MTMHLVGPWLSTTGKKKGKKKFRNADVANRARQNAESWQAFLDKWGVKPDDNKTSRKPIQKSTWMGPTVNSRVVVDPRRLTNHIPSLDTGAGIAVKKEVTQYTGTAMLGIGQLHKSNAIPVFSKEDAIDISKMRRG
jgi:hypothetical protein